MGCLQPGKHRGAEKTALCLWASHLAAVLAVFFSCVLSCTLEGGGASILVQVYL